MPDPEFVWGLPHVCPRCDAAYSSWEAADECARTDDAEDAAARRAARRR